VDSTTQRRHPATVHQTSGDWHSSIARGLRAIPHWAYAVVALYWLGIVFMDAAALRLDQDPDAISWPHYYLKRALLNLYWFVASILALGWYAERQLSVERFGSTLALTILVTLVATAGFSLWMAAVFSLFTEASRSEILRAVWSGGLVSRYLTAWQIVIATNAFHYYRQLMSKRKESADLQLKLARTELMLFRAQLEPHFLFNALNSIAALVRLRRHEAAVNALNELSTLLRSILEVGQRQVMPWHWESEFARLYVGLQKLRFDDQLDVQFDAEHVPPETPIPILLLQPLLENAIHHGPLADGEHCKVAVRLRCDAGRIQLQVSNAVARTEQHLNGGLGLSNVAARLKGLYGDDCSFASTSTDGLFIVRAEFPVLAE
jgi:sensor histidine kinase YesM